MENDMLTCNIIDDDMVSRGILDMYINRTKKLKLLATFSSAFTAQSSLQLSNADLIFLDVEMPGMDGFQLLGQQKIKGKVILTSAERSHALKGYDFKVLDFLLKPVSYDRFMLAVNKAEQGKSQPEETDYVVFKSGKTIYRLLPKDILYVEGANEYLNVVTKTGHFLVYMTIAEIIKLLPDQLIQVHRSYVVNQQNVSSLTRHTVTINKKDIPISKTYQKNALDQLAHIHSETA
jgi:DNA-binding LytR/AlgR family response regulator